MADASVILVTGATDGIGRLAALSLARSGATVLVHGRDPARTRAAASAVEGETGRPCRPYIADLADLAAVRRLAAEIAAAEPRLTALVNNAGIGPGRDRSLREESPDGHELRIAVNYLAPALLARLLLPLLRASAPARIVNVASGAQAPLDPADPMLRRGYDGLRAYAQSKLMLVMHTFDLAEELAGTGVTATCLHPGSLLDTKMVHEAFGEVWGRAEEGAAAVARLAIDPAIEGVTGAYVDETRPARAHEAAYDREGRTILRALTEGWIGPA